MIPPRWVFRIGWALHKALFAASGGRLAAERPRDGKLGTLFLSSTGRTSGQVRRNALYYLEDGPNIAVVASNIGADVDPSWWLNLQAWPEGEVELGRTRRAVRARRGTPEEKARMWPRFAAGFTGYDEYLRKTKREIPIVVLEPRKVRGDTGP